MRKKRRLRKNKGEREVLKVKSEQRKWQYGNTRPNPMQQGKRDSLAASLLFPFIDLHLTLTLYSIPIADMYIKHVLCHLKGVNPIIAYNHRPHLLQQCWSIMPLPWINQWRILSIKLIKSFPPFLFPLVDIPNMSPTPLFSLSHHLTRPQYPCVSCVCVCACASHLARIL